MIKLNTAFVQSCTILCVVCSLFVPTQTSQTAAFNKNNMQVSYVEFESNQAVPLPDIKPKQVTLVRLENTLTQSEAIKVAGLLSRSTTKAKQKIKPNEQPKPEEKALNSYSHGFKPLSAKQAKLYKKIFDTQVLGNFEQADTHIALLEDKRLMGHVLYQRYMHPEYKTPYGALKSWLDAYAELPGADKIYRLAKLRAPDGKHDLKKPVKHTFLKEVYEPTIERAKHYSPTKPRSAQQQKQVRALEKKISRLVRQNKPLEAAKLLRDSPTAKLIDTVERDKLQTRIAAGFLYRQRFNSAFKLSRDAAARSGKYVPEAAWIAGLSLWNKGEYNKAGAYFIHAGRSEYASGWLSSAGYFWAARAEEKTGKGKRYYASLQLAAKHTHTFYGLLAASRLQKDLEFNWDKPKYNQADESLILEHTAGQRAFALVAASQHEKAEIELMRLNFSGKPALRHAVLAYATRTGLPRLSSRLGNRVKHPESGYFTSAQYPNVPWTPQDNYHIDSALLHAIMRQESRFNTQAKSHSGALGLMQIMPTTAEYIAKKRGYESLPTAATLKQADTNMTIGQDYVEYLLKMRMVNQDIIAMLVSYNAGPGNLQKWRKRMQDVEDPLLFIEMIPIHETRDYVERVLANYWIYQSRTNKKLPSLTALSEGKVMNYASVLAEAKPYTLTSK